MLGFKPYTMFAYHISYVFGGKTPRNQFLFSSEFKLAFEIILGPDRQTARSFGCYKVEKEWHQKI